MAAAAAHIRQSDLRRSVRGSRAPDWHADADGLNLSCDELRAVLYALAFAHDAPAAHQTRRDELVDALIERCLGPLPLAIIGRPEKALLAIADAPDRLTVKVPWPDNMIVEQALAHVNDATSRVMERAEQPREVAFALLAAIPDLRRKLTEPR